MQIAIKELIKILQKCELDWPHDFKKENDPTKYKINALFDRNDLVHGRGIETMGYGLIKSKQCRRGCVFFNKKIKKCH